jgi:hypothetical protein
MYFNCRKTYPGKCKIRSLRAWNLQGLKVCEIWKRRRKAATQEIILHISVQLKEISFCIFLTQELETPTIKNQDLSPSQEQQKQSQDDN